MNVLTSPNEELNLSKMVKHHIERLRHLAHRIELDGLQVRDRREFRERTACFVALPNLATVCAVERS